MVPVRSRRNTKLISVDSVVVTSVTLYERWNVVTQSLDNSGGEVDLQLMAASVMGRGERECEHEGCDVSTHVDVDVIRPPRINIHVSGRASAYPCATPASVVPSSSQPRAGRAPSTATPTRVRTGAFAHRCDVRATGAPKISGWAQGVASFQPSSPFARLTGKAPVRGWRRSRDRRRAARSTLVVISLHPRGMVQERVMNRQS